MSASNLMSLADAKYVALETFKKNGESVNTPIWILGDQDGLCAVTGANSWKVRRIRNNPRARVAKSDSRGVSEGDWFEGRAQVLTDASIVQDYASRVARKYGMFGRFMLLMMRFRGAKERVVIRIEPVTDTKSSSS